MIRSNLCDYSDGYILGKGTITIPNRIAGGAVVNNAIKKVIFKNCAQFTDWITKTNNAQVDYAQDIDITMPMNNLREYIDSYLKMSGNLWQYYRDKPAVDNNNNSIYFPADNNNIASFKFKQQ